MSEYRRTAEATVLMAAMAVLVLAGNAQAKGKETVLHSFTGFAGGGDGSRPQTDLVRDKAGNLYGTTYFGGASDNGAVFKLSPNGKETVLYSFTGGSSDGANPAGGLVRDKAGNLYGTTRDAGIAGTGVVFKLTPDGTETILHMFTGGTANDKDGGRPQADMIMDKKDNLYGTTNFGGGRGDCNGNNCGTVFKITPDGAETVLYAFSGGKDGGYPYAPVIVDAKGNLYGMTTSGGDTTNCGSGCGVVFKVTPGGKETVLHAFAGGSGDGRYPVAGLAADSAGNLFGVTSGGGLEDSGVAFKLTLKGKETILHHFITDGGGLGPTGSMVMDNAGNLYGTAQNGGTTNNGVVFKLTPKGKEAALYSFTGGTSDGWWPFSGVILDDQGNLYGTTIRGGAQDQGTVFKLAD